MFTSQKLWRNMIFNLKSYKNLRLSKNIRQSVFLTIFYTVVFTAMNCIGNKQKAVEYTTNLWKTENTYKFLKLIFVTFFSHFLVVVLDLNFRIVFNWSKTMEKREKKLKNTITNYWFIMVIYFIKKSIDSNQSTYLYTIYGM